MAKQNAFLRSFSITQYFDIEYWLNLDDTLEFGLIHKNVDLIIEWIVAKLKEKDWEIDECYAIIHDKDVRTVWNEDIMCEITEKKEPHIHASIKFKQGFNIGATIDAIADAIGVAPQYIEKPQSGRYSWDNQLSYLIHAKDKAKYPYNPKDVYTCEGRDYMSIYEESKKRWERGAIVKENKQAIEDVEWLEREILQGKIVRSQVLLTDEYYLVYSMNKRRIDDAFDSYGQRKMFKALRKLEQGEFKTTVYYVMGQAGKGKTSFANKLIEETLKSAKDKLDEDWTICKTASLNPVDDYQGEEILLMDDVRGSSMRADDWLKLLDPWNSSPSSARYKNKVVTARVVIITATMSPVDFFYYSKGVGKGDTQMEAVDQFLRRLMGIIHVLDFDKIEIKRALPDANSKGFVLGKSGDVNPVVAQSNFKIEKDKFINNMNLEDVVLHLTDEIISNNKLK